MYFIGQHIVSYNRTRVPTSNEDLSYILSLQTILLLIFPTFFLIIGVPGNILTIFALTKRSLKDNVFSLYLSSMCFFNILTLLCHMPRFITQAIIYRDLYLTHVSFCITFRIFSVTVGTVANWHLVIITAARLFYVIERTKRFVRFYCYPPYVIIALVIFISTVQIPSVYAWLRFKNDLGDTVLCYQSSQSSMVYLQILFQTIVPALAIISMNLYIVMMHKARDYGLAENENSARMRRNLVKLLAVSSVQYLLCMLPTCIYFPNQRRFFDVRTRSGRAKANLAYSFVLMVIYTNNATNFITYCFFGHRFRTEFFRLLNALFLRDCPDFQFKTVKNESGSDTTKPLSPGNERSLVKTSTSTTGVDLIKKLSGQLNEIKLLASPRLKFQRESIV